MGETGWNTHLPKLICDPVALARLGSPARVELGAGVVVGDETDEPGAPAPFTHALLDAHLDLLMEDARDRGRVHFRHFGDGEWDRLPLVIRLPYTGT